MTPARRPLIRLATPAAIAAILIAGHASAAEAKVRSGVSGQLLTVRGGNGNDRVSVGCSGQGLVQVNGKDPRTGAVACARVSEVDAVMGAGNDRVNFSGVGSSTGFAERDLAGFGRGTGAAAQLGRGNDFYVGGGSAFNLVLGSPGDDGMTGGALRDDLEGGAGNDHGSGGDGRDVILGNAGADVLGGGAGDDLLSGNSGADRLSGGPGADLLGGGVGKDTLLGGDGDDQLIGGPDKDRLNGGAGNNELIQNSRVKK